MKPEKGIDGEHIETVIDIYNKLGSDLTDYRRNSIV